MESPHFRSDRLIRAFHSINENPSPHVPNPPGTTKRASVALIIRFRPFNSVQEAALRSTPPSGHDQSDNSILQDYFDQHWLRSSTPEILLIKRAARKGDRWTSHVALPGGRRDPEDADDFATSVRETREEVGLHLDSSDFVRIGKLPERVVTTSWGKQPLMVLCPIVFLALRFDLPSLELQPTEVHSAHWVALGCLLAPSNRTFERADISDRAMGSRGPLAKLLVRLYAGYLQFSAVRLRPSESLTSTNTPSPSPPINTWIPKVLHNSIQQHHARQTDPPLLLWGLTLGMISDLLDRVEPTATAELWSWPTFSHWDMRVWLWILGWRFRTRRVRDLKLARGWVGEQRPAPERQRRGTSVSPEPRTEQTSADQRSTPEPRQEDVLVEPVVMDNSTFATTTTVAPSQQVPVGNIAGGHLIDGYFALMKMAVGVSAAARAVAAVGLVVLLVRRYRLRAGR